MRGLYKHTHIEIQGGLKVMSKRHIWLCQYMKSKKYIGNKVRKTIVAVQLHRKLDAKKDG